MWRFCQAATDVRKTPAALESSRHQRRGIKRCSVSDSFFYLKQQQKKTTLDRRNSDPASCRLQFLCESRPEVVATAAQSLTSAFCFHRCLGLFHFVVKLKTSPSLKGKLPDAPPPPHQAVALFISPHSLHSANIWAPNTSSEHDTAHPSLLSQSDQ